MPTLSVPRLPLLPDPLRRIRIPAGWTRSRPSPRARRIPARRAPTRSSLFGPDTDKAFGHLGFTNILGWADPERRLAVGLITRGKPVLHHGLPQLWALTRRIGLEAPKR